MISRDLTPVLLREASRYPVVTLTGPRQSGKTTLCRQAFPNKPYISLEAMDTRGFAQEDPRGFLEQWPGGAILDEVQRAPDLLGYIQERVDVEPTAVQYILTGSQHLGLSAAINQSLAGRTAVLHLLPMTLSELRRFDNAPQDLYGTLLGGAYPRIYHRGIPAARWLADYIETYIQRDVRTVLNVGSLDTFTSFLRLCAAHTGQELNLHRLGSDSGVSHTTAKAWLSVLETNFICTRLPAWQVNTRKRLVRAPKLHFYDTGLVCYLLGIQTAQQLYLHPLRGPIFETWVVAELLKQRHHAGLTPHLHHYREISGTEVDVMAQDGLQGMLVEMKSSKTVSSKLLEPMVATLETLQQERSDCTWSGVLLYGGERAQRRQNVAIVPWHQVGRLAPGNEADKAHELTASDPV